KDRGDFVGRLSKLLPEMATPCYAWALMDNHVHLLLRTGTSPIATVMRRLLTGYAVSFNRRHGRYGNLFQNRYKSILCEEGGYLKQLVAYIHLNPFRAGIVEDVASLRTFPYTGHSALMGKKKRPWQDTDYVLKHFGRRVSEAATRELSISGSEVGRRLNVDRSAICRAVQRAGKDADLAAAANTILKSFG
ncbi:MAG: transposase, partial [Deltaproteobacteria bacterium]|nr:transposase [Deltaproteobacteria bacterium]